MFGRQILRCLAQLTKDTNTILSELQPVFGSKNVFKSLISSFIIHEAHSVATAFMHQIYVHTFHYPTLVDTGPGVLILLIKEWLGVHSFSTDTPWFNCRSICHQQSWTCCQKETAISAASIKHYQCLPCASTGFGFRDSDRSEDRYCLWELHYLVVGDKTYM